MRNNVILIAAILFMFVFGLQLAEPAAAANLKVVDHGSIKFKDTEDYNNTLYYKWKTYQKGINYVEIIGCYYSPIHKYKEYIYEHIQKVSKSKVKIYGKLVFIESGTHHSMNFETYYAKTKLTAAQYYWRVERPDMLKNP